MSWADWFAHLKAVPGFAAGGIYAIANGACCHQEGVAIDAATVSAITSAFNAGTPITISGVKFQVLQRTKEMFQARKDGVPVCVYKTHSMYLLVVGAKDVPPGPLSTALGKAADSFKGSNL